MRDVLAVILGGGRGARLFPLTHLRSKPAVPIGGKFRLTTVASPAYLERHPMPLVPEDLRQHNCIRYRWDKDAVANSWRFTKADDQIEVSGHGAQ